MLVKDKAIEIFDQLTPIQMFKAYELLEQISVGKVVSKQKKQKTTLN